MVHTSHAFALEALAREGLIDLSFEPVFLGGGNDARIYKDQIGHFKVRLTNLFYAKLTMAPDLIARAKRHAQFAHACPILTQAPVFFRKYEDCDILAEPFISGRNVDELRRKGELDHSALIKLGVTLREQLDHSQRASTDAAREQEWNVIAARMADLEQWSPREHEIFNQTVLPLLHKQLFTTDPVLQWVHGDLSAGNILMRDTGEPALIDLEFAQETHFGLLEWIRFAILNHLDTSEILPALTPIQRNAWSLFFWLTQVERELTLNDDHYLRQWLPHRLTRIRVLTESILGRSLIDCPWPAGPVASSLRSQEIDSHIEDARWAEGHPHDAIVISGWCHFLGGRTLKQVVAESKGITLAEAPPHARPDVQRHFDGNAHALLSGFGIHIPPLFDIADEITLIAYATDGTSVPFHRFISGDLPRMGPIIFGYTKWADHFDPIPDKKSYTQTDLLFTLIVPTYNTPENILRQCIESAQNQFHTHWQMCLVDDASTATHMPRLLTELAEGDSRINLIRRIHNGGISRASNDALSAAKGEFTVMLDHDDLLRPHALSEFASLLAQTPIIDVIYSDEDKITADGVRVTPFLKPAFSPEFLLGVMYPGHALCVRTKIARQIGGFDPAFDGIQDYDLFLRISEHTRQIAHIPRILYHWRQLATSSALHSNAKGNMDKKQELAVRAHLDRQGRHAELRALGGHRLRVSASPLPKIKATVLLAFSPAQAVSVNFWKMLDQEEIEELIVPTLLEVPETQLAKKILRVNACEAWAALQECAGLIESDAVVVLSEPPLSGSKRWIRELSMLAQREDTAIAAPLLLSREGKVLESGWTIGSNKIQPLMRGFDAAMDGYNGSLLCTREVRAVSNRCFALSRSLFNNTSSAPRENALIFHLSTCLKLVEDDRKYNRVTPHARLIMDLSWHETADIESITPGPCYVPFDYKTAEADPYYNKQFYHTKSNYCFIYQ